MKEFCPPRSNEQRGACARFSRLAGVKVALIYGPRADDRGEYHVPAFQSLDVGEEREQDNHCWAPAVWHIYKFENVLQMYLTVSITFLALSIPLVVVVKCKEAHEAVSL